MTYQQAEDILVEIQGILGVIQDGKWGTKSKAALQQVVDIVAMGAKFDDSTLDKRSIDAINSLHPEVQKLAAILVLEARKRGIYMVVTSALRTYEEQDELYAQGRTKPGKIVTNVRGGYSNHNFGLAFDLTLFPGGDLLHPKWEGEEYKTVGQMGKNVGLFWGGDWQSPHDEPHFELRPEWAKHLDESQMIAELRRRTTAGIELLAV